MALNESCAIQAWRRASMTANRLRGAVVLSPAATAADGIGQPSLARFQDHADADFAIPHEADHRRELAVLASEAARAVDGIDDPNPGASLRRAGKRGRLLFGAQGVR